jgi:hypothetical protein
MEMLLILGGLQVILIYSAFSLARSYFNKGRLRGVEEATRELLRGISSHCEIAPQVMPERVLAAVKKYNDCYGKRHSEKGPTKAHYAQLWIVGNAIGEACWLKGHTAGIKRKAPAEGKIRVDLTLTELLQLSGLAHLGFQYMMPNYRGFEVHRFSGEADASEAAKAVSRMECAVPEKHRPFADVAVQFRNRQKLISDWWESPSQLTA